MFYRQKILLNFLSSSNYLSLTKLQKMLFLFCQEHENEFYSFLPYQYGSYSFQAQHDLYLLEARYSVVKKKNKRYIRSSQADVRDLHIKDIHLQKIDRLKKTWFRKPEEKIIYYTYKKFPYYAIHSKLLDKEYLLDLKPLILKERQKKYLPKSIFTIGYEGRSVEDYFNILIENDIKLLCDVRSNPASRKYGFSKKVLSYICQQYNLAYLHIPDLGIKSNFRKDLAGPSDYAKLFDFYKKEILSQYNKFDDLSKAIEQYGRIAFTCFEADSDHCHRKCLAEKIKNITKKPLLHL